MERIILTISSELFDEVEQEASVRKNLTVRALIEEIRQEFGLLEGSYVLKLRGSNAPLESDRTLDQLGIKTGDELVFERERMHLSQQMFARGMPGARPISSGPRAVLIEQSTHQQFPLRWQPAQIGRSSATDPASSQALAVNLANLPEGRTVSRQHAQITERAGHYFLEPLAEQNPTLLNDRALLPGEKRPLTDGDVIQVGKIALTFTLQGG